MIEAVIFDVDGTLVDSVDAHARAWQRAFARFGRTIEFDAIRAQIGKGGDQLMPVFLTRDDIERQGPEIERFRQDLFNREYLGSIRAFPGTRALFQHVRAAGRRVALASSAKADDLAAYEEIAAIADLIDIETSSDDAERSKPHPDIFEAALGKLALAPGAALVVGDTPYDAEAARKAGIRVIGVLCGGFPEADIRAAGAHAVFRDPQDLRARMSEWLVDR